MIEQLTLTQVAELRFTSLLTGQVVLVVPVAGTGTERSQHVALHNLPAGQYAYQLVVDGQLAAAPQKLFIASKAEPRYTTRRGSALLAMMRCILGLLWLALLCGQPKGYAQQVGWEYSLPYSTTPYTAYDALGYIHQLAAGEYVASGIGDRAGNGYPFIYARVSASGALVYQRKGRIFFTLEQGIVPLAGSNGSSLLAASVPARRTGGGVAGTSRLFFQRIRPNGDTLPGLSYPLSFLEGYPTRAVREGDSVRVLTFAIDNQNVGQYALLSTDTLGTVGQVRRYPRPTVGNAYPCDLVRTARSGWLIVGELGTAPYGHPYLVETDAQGRLRRQRELLLFPNSTEERMPRVWSNLLRLRDGSGYVFSGQQRTTTGQTFGFLCKLDTALNVVWTYRHPPQATPALAPRQVYELADGTLAWLAADGVSNTLGGQPTPYLYVLRVSGAGQLLAQQRVSSAACARLSPYAWQPLTGGGALVVGAASVCTAAPGAYPAYVARIDNATLLAAAGPAVPANPAAQVFPNPTSEAATWQGAVPAGAGAAELVLLDVLGRAVRRVPVSGRGAQVSQELDLRGLAAGTYACRLLVAGQPVGTVQKLTYLP